MQGGCLQGQDKPIPYGTRCIPLCCAQLWEAAADVHRMPKKRSGCVLDTKQTLMTFLAC